MSFWFFSRRLKFSGVSDEKLAEYFFRTRSRRSAEELFSRYVHLLFGLCMKYLKDEEKAKDAVMQLTEKVITYTPEKPIQNFKGWLYMVTRNHCLMQLRKEQVQSRYIQIKEMELSEEIMENPFLDSLIDEKELELRSENLHAAINKLSDEQKRCIELFYFHGKSYAEITELTGFEMNAVKSYIQNGKRNLKNLMGHD
jgi:RNA polymerase sigma factor (sigma-70 family)